MDKKYLRKLPNKTAEYFYKISYLCFLSGMPNFWVEDLMPKVITKVHAVFNKICNVAFCVLILMELGAFVTQHELTDKQEADRWIYSISHPIFLSYAMTISHKEEKIKDLLGQMLKLKAIYNDPKVEERMLRKSTLYSTALVVNCILSMVLFSVSAWLQVIKHQETYTTLLTVWPLVDDRSTGASAVRAVTNIVWWLLLNRVYGSFILVISLTAAISYQFVNLQSYFCNLNTIFREDNLNQSQKESKYEEGLKTGIKMHSDTFMCVDRTADICRGVYNGQIVFIITMMVFFMSQLTKPDRTMVNAFATAVSASAVLFSTGLFFLNAGDITIEASDLATAMYSSGWHMCGGSSSVRVRKLVLIAMTRTQNPVILKGFGIMDVSYESFLYLVKTSYSVFSVLF